MPQVLDRKVVEWRTADSRARAAEQALTKALFGQQEHSLLAADLAAEAKKLRRLADEKLKMAIAAMRPKPDESGAGKA
jgi:hypothetical protein